MQSNYSFYKVIDLLKTIALTAEAAITYRNKDNEKFNKELDELEKQCQEWRKWVNEP